MKYALLKNHADNEAIALPVLNAEWGIDIAQAFVKEQEWTQGYTYQAFEGTLKEAQEKAARLI